MSFSEDNAMNEGKGGRQWTEAQAIRMFFKLAMVRSRSPSRTVQAVSRDG